MDPQLADGEARDLAQVEAEVGELRAALDEARAATKAAEEKLHERQTEEAEKRQAYELAHGRMKEAYAAERQRLEDARRAAEEGLLALDSKLQDFNEEAPGSSDGRSGAAPTIEERLAALLPTELGGPATQDGGDADASAYEDDWYRTLAQRSKEGVAEEGDTGD